MLYNNLNTDLPLKAYVVYASLSESYRVQLDHCPLLSCDFWETSLSLVQTLIALLKFHLKKSKRVQLQVHAVILVMLDFHLMLTGNARFSFHVNINS